MVKRILVDASHPEETRVAVADDSKLIEFDFETLERKQIKSNIYLGKITRVEPSLQAAFVEYGGNRQGFLPFSEIHFDYFQIPTEDKEKLAAALRSEQERLDKLEEHEFNEAEKANSPVPVAAPITAAPAETPKAEMPQGLSPEEQEAFLKAIELEKQFALEIMGEEYVTEKYGEIVTNEPVDDFASAIDEGHTSRSDFYKQYKIQEVIKRNQIVLIQVVKEERGNKGASLTTYVAIPGRFCVFMPNTENGGGVSRRIASFADRKRMREVLKQMEIPVGTSAIMRTAGVDKEPEEIKKDLDYLISLWNNIRKQTLESTAPSLIYEESDIVKRSLRDLFRTDVNEIIIEGEQAYNSTIQFMEVVSPEQKSIVRKFSGKQSIFDHYGIEDQLDELYEPISKLESGGYVVITPTEALVSIDVNSGKATRERNVEDTAYRTNIEAAREIARQLRLRDLAGLVVIDFIDMRDVRNRKGVERELKDALKSDRAKIQVGRISPFGLLEMSRQRLRASIVDSSSTACPMCKGLGVVRSNESLSVKILRAIEAEASKNNIREIRLDASSDIAYNLLNRKREEIRQIEEKEDVRIYINGNHDLLPNQYKIDSLKGRNKRDNFQSSPNQNIINQYSAADSEAFADTPKTNIEGVEQDPQPRSERPERAERPDRGERPERGERRFGRNNRHSHTHSHAPAVEGADFNTPEVPEYLLSEEGNNSNYEPNFNSDERGPRRRNDRKPGTGGPRTNGPRINGEGGKNFKNNRNRNRRGGGRDRNRDFNNENLGNNADGNREFNGNEVNGNYDASPSFEPINDNGFKQQKPAYKKYSDKKPQGSFEEGNFDNHPQSHGSDEGDKPTSKLKGLWKKITS